MIGIDRNLTDVRNLRPDLHAILKIRTGEIGGRIANLQRVVAGVPQRHDCLRLASTWSTLRCRRPSRENVGGHFLARLVQKTNDRIEERRSGRRRFHFHRDVGRAVQMESRAMRFAGLRQRSFERAGQS